MTNNNLFADVLLPLPVKGYFTYLIPENLIDKTAEGKRVVVPFGTKKLYAGLIRKIHSKTPRSGKVKELITILDEKPLIKPSHFSFWEWIAEYYLCTTGEVMNAAMPAALKLSSETSIKINPGINLENLSFNIQETALLNELQKRKELTISQAIKSTGISKILPVINNLIEKQAIIAQEFIQEIYKPKKDTFIKLSPEYENDDQSLKEHFEYAEKRAPRQLEVLLTYIKISGRSEVKSKGLALNQLLSDIENGEQAVKSLVKKGIFQIYQQEASRFEHGGKNNEGIIFNKNQNIAFEEIKSGLQEKGIALLHGVTSSGKTEIYIKLIQEYISVGKQVLYLLPEIALTAQIIQRLQKYFGQDVGIYHSRFNDMERAEVWNNIAKGGIKSDGGEISYKVVLGARSAVFLPFNNLGLVIVDEEHDTNYKQYNPAPRYNGRDTAVYLAKLTGSKVLLGSATPSIESYSNSKSGKYHLVELNKRHGDIQMPEIMVADIKKETRQRTMKSHFSSLLLENINRALEDKEQVILFQNRRGFSLFLQCKECEAMPHCKNCDVSLVYHKNIGRLKCHYCGYSIKPPSTCNFCGSPNVMMKGFGTEKIEEELPLFFPKARIARMDLDTTRSKNSYQKIIADFENKKVDILVGTQMVSKGLDFSDVSVVGILNGDNLIHFPDFRSYERAFQQLTQVSGRAGRTNKRGKVIIQSYNPHHDVFAKVIENDYAGMYNQQMIERRNFKYPPFYKLILLQLVHKNPDLINKGSNLLADRLRSKFGKNVLGPEYPLISRIRNLYSKNIIVKIAKNKEYSKNKRDIMLMVDEFQKLMQYKSVRVIIDVDPA